MDEERIYRTERMNDFLPYIRPSYDIGDAYKELLYITMDKTPSEIDDLLETIEEEMNKKRDPSLSYQLLDVFQGYKADNNYICAECNEEFVKREGLIDHLKDSHSLPHDDIVIYEEETVAEKIADIYQEEDWNKKSFELLNLPTTDGELMEIAIYFGFDNCDLTKGVFNFSDLRYVPESFSEFKDFKRTAEIIRGRKFEYTKLVEENQLKEDEEEVLLSIIALTINYSPYKCFPSSDLNSCRDMKKLKRAFDLELIKNDGSYPENQDLEIDRLQEILGDLSNKKLIDPSLRYRRHKRRKRKYGLGSYNVTKKVCSRLFSPFFIEEKYKEKTNIKASSLFERSTDDRRYQRPHRSKRGGFLHDRDEKEEKTDDIPSITFDDVILPNEMLNKIDRLLLTDEQADKLYNKWGFKDVMETGKGTVMLFTGPPGTGKTHTAKSIANKLNKSLHQVDFADVVSCWLGKTGSNVKKAFEVCEENDKVLLIDECDAVLGKRGKSISSGGEEMERVVNILLQKIEETGITVIMTTNLSAKLDKALKRRIDLVLQFPSPDSDLRELLWRKHIPKSIILHEDVDFCKLADKYKLNGGEIKNAAFNAAKIAVKEGSEKIHMKHFEETVEEEKDKKSAMGYNLNDEDDDDDLSMFM